MSKKSAPKVWLFSKSWSFTNLCSSPIRIASIPGIKRSVERNSILFFWGPLRHKRPTCCLLDDEDEQTVVWMFNLVFH